MAKVQFSPDSIAGYLSSKLAGRIGRFSKFPPQLGQMPLRMVSTQVLQKVHSNEQIIASSLSVGNEQSQFSQFDLSFNIVNFC